MKYILLYMTIALYTSPSYFHISPTNDDQRLDIFLQYNWISKQHREYWHLIKLYSLFTCRTVDLKQQQWTLDCIKLLSQQQDSYTLWYRLWIMHQGISSKKIIQPIPNNTSWRHLFTALAIYPLSINFSRYEELSVERGS